MFLLKIQLSITKSLNNFAVIIAGPKRYIAPIVIPIPATCFTGLLFTTFPNNAKEFLPINFPPFSNPFNEYFPTVLAPFIATLLTPIIFSS